MSLEQQFKNTKPGDVGIMGDPVEHSLSPVMQNAALKTWKMAFEDRELVAPVYHKFHVRADELEKAVQLIKLHKLRGVNVTVPHKIQVGRYIDTWDIFSKRSGSVNTLLVEQGKIKGFNTDGDGFRRAIERDLDLDMQDREAFVAGLGGTGRVVVLQLLAMGAKSVFVWNRSLEKISEFLNILGEDHQKIVVLSDQDLKEGRGESAELVVNATSLGLKPNDPSPLNGYKFHAGQFVFDVVYHYETQFLKQAKNAGAHCFGGEGMLLYQGAKAFEIWTGTPAPLDLMHNALITQLKGTQ